jgi:hypothetical protein
MADIRINSLPTTASASSSNDFLAIDGATNGTRKLSAYSPTFGGAVTINGNGTYGAIQLPSGTTSIYGVAFGTDTNLWRTDSGNLELGGSSVALIGLNVGGTNKGYFYNNGTDTTLAGAGTLTFKSNGTTTGLTLDSSNATLAGNLTVSGTGTSNVGGTLVVGSTSAASGSGKLELASHTTSAGGIGFGTDNQLFRYNGVQVALTNASGTSGSAIASNLQLRVENSGNGGIQINVPDASTGGVYFGRAADAYYSAVERSGTNLLLRNNGTTALTLDSSQNATFAGSVTATTSSASGVESGFSNTAVNTAAYSLFSIKTASGGGDPYLLFYNVGVEAWSIGMDVSDSNSWKLSRSTSVGSNDRLTITTAGNATFAGSIAINNTVQTAAAVASTHKVTISIGGSTYYLLATNV